LVLLATLEDGTHAVDILGECDLRAYGGWITLREQTLVRRPQVVERAFFFRARRTNDSKAIRMARGRASLCSAHSRVRKLELKLRADYDRRDKLDCNRLDHLDAVLDHERLQWT
jgi:hypothetical protein